MRDRQPEFPTFEDFVADYAKRHLVEFLKETDALDARWIRDAFLNANDDVRGRVKKLLGG